MEALLAHAMLSIPATKGFEIGSGFEGTKLQGSEHNDMFILNKKDAKLIEENKADEIVKLNTKSNNAGGTLGGITSGENIVQKIVFSSS